MKKVLKNRIFIVIITLIIGVSGTLYAGAKYQASEIIYNPSSGDSMTANDALNEIYNIKSLGNATEEDIANGKTAVVQGQLITGVGSKIIIEYIGISYYQGKSIQFFSQDIDGKFYYLYTGHGDQNLSTTHIYSNGGLIKAKTAGKFYICSAISGNFDSCKIVTATEDQDLVSWINQGGVFAFYLG